jgi:peroxiredoxin
MGKHQPATDFSLPGVIGGDAGRVNVGSRIGESVVVLVFYPSNFGPQNGRSATVLRTVEGLVEGTDRYAVGIAPESVHSHEQFAPEAGIDLPLASDMDATVADTYDVVTTHESGQRLPELSLFVLDYRGVVVEEWRASGPADMPDFQRLRSRLRTMTPDRSARGCYRIGYARYREGRWHLSSGLAQAE